METEKSYYDFDIDVEWFIDHGTLDEMFWLKDVLQRKFYLNYDVDQDGIHNIVRHILQINREDAGIPAENRKPIILYVASRGGVVDDGFELIDAIESSVTPVYTVNIGYAYSMAFLVMIAGHRRYSTRNAKFLMHDGTSFVWDSGAKAQDRMAFSARVEQRVKDFVLRHSNLSEEEYDSKLRVEWYMFADEAKEKGFIDCVIGDDGTLEEVV